MSQSSHYDSLDTMALQSILLNTDQKPEAHRAALSALARRSFYQRSKVVVEIMRSVLRHPDRYDQDAMMALIDIMATDPEAEATEIMLRVLPDMVEAALDSNRAALKSEFRNYYYQALITRQRDDDLVVWGEMLPQLDVKTLVGTIVDPAAAPLEAIEPFTLIDRQPEPQRTKALISIIAGVARSNSDPKHIQTAIALLTKSADKAQLSEGIAVLAQQWERAKKAGRHPATDLLENALRLLDDQPRTTAERLTGKRP